MLGRHGLDGYVRFFVIPLNSGGGYDFDAAPIEKYMGGNGVDWILIDGPFGPPGCRLGTLVDLAKFCSPRARWFLDDAFRDAELGILQRWSTYPSITIEGILATREGLATGTLSSARQSKQ
jgi:hypothetical protein